jgi:hypothetical protein
MATSPAIAKQCTDLAGTRASAMLGRAIEQAIAGLQQEEQRCNVVAQRQELADAWLELSRRREDWAQRYAQCLQAAQAVREAPAAKAPAGADRFGGLALVDEDAIVHEIESARVLQLIAPKLEQPLAELEGLMSTALGLETVQPERNPLRPQVFARALQELMQPAPQPGMPKLWGRHLAGPLASEIAAFYGDVLKLLRAARLASATYRVLPTASAAAVAAPQPTALPARPAGAVSPGAASSGTMHAQNGGGIGAAASVSGSQGAGGPAIPTLGNSGVGGAASLGGASWADLSGYQLGDELFQNFLFSRAQPSTQALAPSYYARVDAQVAAVESGAESYEPYDMQFVQQQRTLSPVERPARPVATTRELDDAVWGRWAPARERSLHRSRLKKEARQVGQVLGLEVVRKLVDQVARDPRLLAPVREAIVAVEPALLRLALAQPRFFSQEDHAGRRLVERVAERSFRYNDEFSTEFQEFFSGVHSAVQGLNEQEVQDDRPFAQVLRKLEERWAAEDVVEERGRKVAVDAIHFAEAREAEAAQIAWSLSQRSDLEGVPAVVQDFLYGPWSLVMAHARLTESDNKVDPGGWTSVVTDLLWSVKPEQTLRDPARLFTTIPGMLERLRNGMNLLGQEQAENDTFFNALEKLHSPVLKLRAKSRRASHALDSVAPVDAALLSTERQQPRAPGGDPWLSRTELAAAGFVDEQPSAPAPLEEACDDLDVNAVVAGLQQGSWVDLYARDRWRRASLTWVSSRATLFMFVSNGGQPHSMTRRSLERLVRERMLRPVEAGAVVPRAIEALSQQRAHAAAPAPARRAAGEVRLAA